MALICLRLECAHEYTDVAKISEESSNIFRNTIIRNSQARTIFFFSFPFSLRIPPKFWACPSHKFSYKISGSTSLSSYRIFIPVYRTVIGSKEFSGALNSMDLEACLWGVVLGWAAFIIFTYYAFMFRTITSA